MNSTIKLAFIFALFLIITACSATENPESIEATQLPTNTPIPPTETPLPPTTTPTSTATNTPTDTPTSTATEAPTATATEEPTATETATATAVPQAAAPSNVLVKYLVHQGTGGPIGCGDSLVSVSTGFLPTGDIKEDVKIALNSLFSTGSKYVGDFYNPLYQSNLRVASVKFKKSSGQLTIHLKGGFTKPKDECDKMLYRAQVWDTARQFPEVWRAYIWIGDLLLGDLLAVGGG